VKIRPRPVTPAAGQETVWDYPRPPRLEPFLGSITVELGGKTIALTNHAWRVLETSHPPTYYLPRDACSPRGCCARRRVRRGALSPAPFGEARYSWSAAFTSSPFTSRSKNFDENKAASRPPRLRKVSRNHTTRWFTGKR